MTNPDFLEFCFQPLSHLPHNSKTSQFGQQIRVELQTLF
jgi:hypothetical protein